MTTGRRNTSAQGPRLARWLLLTTTRTPGAEAILGDIEEGYAAGRSLAWYWAQVLGSVLWCWRHSLRSNGFAQDLRVSARRLKRRPGFSFVVVLTLALGIGANAAIFSIVNEVLLTPLPYADPERLLVVRTDLPAQDIVSAGFLPTLGVEPMLGRLPLPEEDLAGGPRVIVLARPLWQRRYGADPDIVGTQIEMDSESYTVVAVMPVGFEMYLPPDVGMPLRPDAWVPFGGRYNEYASAGYDLRIEPLNRSVVAHARPLLLVLLGAVGLFLLIVCANVANLYLARAGEVRREVAVRRALGATRGRLLRALGMECALITGLGAAAGLLIAYWAIGVLPLLAPAELQRVDAVALDFRVIGFATLVAAATAMMFATVSALELRPSTESASALRGGTRSAGSAASSRLRGALLVVELALSLMLLIGVGLMVRSFANLAAVDTGFEPEGVVSIKMSLVDSHFPYAEPERIAGFLPPTQRGGCGDARCRCCGRHLLLAVAEPVHDVVRLRDCRRGHGMGRGVG